MTGAKLSKTAIRALRSVKKERRINDFAKKAKVHVRTVQKMAKGGYVAIDKIRKVEAALEMDGKPRTITADMVEVIVCTSYGITPDALRNSRHILVSEARQVAFLLMKEEGKLARSVIAARFGYTDKSCVSHQLKRLNGRIEVEEDLQRRVRRIRVKLFAA